MIETINNPDTALILLVDDSEDIRIQVKHYLASEGYRFIEGTNGQEALTLFEQHHPDLIMLDLAMPGIDGIETCARLRLLPGGEQVPVLVLTAMDDRESIDNAFNAGADEYVNKPVHWPVLRHRIKSLLEVSRGKARLEAIEDLHMLQRIVTACTSTLKLDEILQITLNEALAIAGLEGGSICLKSADDTLHLVAEKGASAETISNLTTNGIKVGECLCGSCAQDMNPLILWNREEVQNYSSRETQIGKDIRFHASFAFVYKEKCVGVLCVSTRTDKKPSEKSLKLLETMSAQVALTIENARLYEMEVENAASLEIKVRERNAELEKANVRLKELNRLKSLFIASISHELRTPLNSIIGFIGMTLKGMSGDLNEEQRDNLSRSYKAAIHLLALISDVIDISKIETGRVEVFIEDFFLTKVIDEVAASLRPQIEEKGLALEVMIQEPIQMHTDRNRLTQCLTNLLSNAVKYTEKGEIHVTAKVIGEEVELSVIDTGIGIEEENLHRLFESFERIQSHISVKAGGTGLGLYLTKKLATQQLLGSVSVQSEAGKGSTFSLKLPIDLQLLKKAEIQ